MANALTGDFDAVLQVSNTLLDRLAATMHQNGFPHPNLPSLPHEVHFRIEGNEHGSVAAQAGCPHVVLINGATDRVQVQTGFRARFTADPGSPPLADIINGTINATYRVQDIDPTCPGWRDIADDYIWLRVLRSSVAFDGDSYNLTNAMALTSLGDLASLDTRITKNLATLLADGFAPKPFAVGKRFKRFRSVVTGPGPGQSALTFPFALGDEEPTGSLNSVGEVFHDGHDFAVAVNRDVIVGAIYPKVSETIGFQRNFYIRGDAGMGGGLSLDYHVIVDGAAVNWLGAAPLGISGGVIRITVQGYGYCSRLYTSGVYNIDPPEAKDLRMRFSIQQYLSLQFDPSHGFSISVLGAPIVDITYNGPYADDLKSRAQSNVNDFVKPMMALWLAAASGQLAAYTAPERLAGMLRALQSVDPAAGVGFDKASYHADGLVLHGSVRLPPRSAPHVAFSKSTTDDGYDAIASWIPGGRIDRFEWTWRFYTTGFQAAPGPPGSVTNQDTYELRRPYKGRNNFGEVLGARKPLPGLDGMGKVCLTLRGRRVDPVTGSWVPITSTTECLTFGYQFRVPMEMAPKWTLFDPMHEETRRPREIGVISAAGTGLGPNLLVYYAGRQWDSQQASVAVEGLKACKREGATLVVLALFAEDALENADAGALAALRRFDDDIVAPVLIAEDSGGRWAPYLGVSGDRPQWRLLGPDGVLRWVPESDFSSDDLAQTLSEALARTGPPGYTELRPDVDIGGRFDLDLPVTRCPPVTLGRPDLRPGRVAFVDTGLASRDALEWAAQQDDSVDLIAVVVRDASEEQAAEIAKRLDDNVAVVADPDGMRTQRAGIVFTPSIVGLDPSGRVAEVRTEPPPQPRRQEKGGRS